METLPSHYTRGSNQLHGGQFHHTRIDDNTQKKAMYKVEFKPTHSDTMHVVGYEVFLIKIQKACDMPVKIKDKLTGKIVESVVHYEEREGTPSDGVFGSWAFNCRTLAEAEKKFAELVIPEIQLDEAGNEIKRKRGRPAKQAA
jgi:hypothetical protein